MAFVSSFTPSFGSTVFFGSAPQSTCSSSLTSVKMAFSMDKYAKMNNDAVRGATAAPAARPGTSAYWGAYRENQAKAAPKKQDPGAQAMAAMLSTSTPFFRILATAASKNFGAGGDPDTQIGRPDKQAADRYMAKCMTQQYKQSACPAGVYSTSCTEASTPGGAEDARVAALAAQFRMKQRSTAQKYGDFCENRRKGMVLAHGCSYEENLVASNVVSARTFVQGVSEKQGTCVRYAVGNSPAEDYMARSVDMQYKALGFGASTGVYSVQCCDGTTSGMAEKKRVAALATRFRSRQLPRGKQEQAKFDSRLYARTMFRSCNYEQAVTENYPAVAASMRPLSARY